MFDYYPRSLTVGERRAKAAAEMRRQKKAGKVLSPVLIEGRAIAKTFWGKAWCKNLEAYKDFAYRLPRGRSYARHHSVIDLRIGEGQIDALVVGTELYTITVTVSALPEAQWAALKADCAGAIESLVELLQGRFSEGVMARLCQQETGLFPTPDALDFSCSCPDWAQLCKHVAAALYGVGARLDTQPELLFTLRGVEPDALLEAAAGLPLGGTPESDQILDDDDLDIFGLELDDEAWGDTASASPAPGDAVPQERDAFRDWLREKDDEGTIVANFEALETLLEGLPEAARADPGWWSDAAGALQARWMAEGYAVKQVWVDREWVVLQRPTD